MVGEDYRATAEDGALALPIEIFQPEFVEFGGEERVILSLAKRLHEIGKAVRVLCFRDQIGLRNFADFPLPVRALEPGAGARAKARSLAAHLHYGYSHGAPTPMLCNIQSAYLAGMAVGSPYHLRIPDTFRLLTRPRVGMGNRVREKLLHYLVSRGIRRAQSFSTNTSALRAEMKALYRREAAVIYLGGTQRVEALPKRVVGPVRALSVSRVQASKRIDWMIEAMTDLSFRRPDLPPWTLDIVGRGPELESLEALVQSRDLARRVRFLGFVSDDQLSAAYTASHLFLMPAVQGYGIPAIEALDQRLAVVLSRASGVSEILTDTPWAVVTDDNPAAFAGGIASAVERIIQTNLLAGPTHPTPTARGWADEIIELSGWIR